MKLLRFIRCLAFALGLTWACGVASAIDLATLATRVEWNASVFHTAIVCDQPGRPTVVLPEIITQKVQESYRTNGLAYYQDTLSMSEREGRAISESYRLPTNYYGQVYRYSLPNDNSRFLFVYSQIENEVSSLVSFCLYDFAKDQASATSVTQSTWCLDPGIESGMATNRLGDPYITFADIDEDGVPEVVSYEADHAGTDDWQLYYHYYRVENDLALKCVLTQPAEVLVFVPGRHRGYLRSRLVPLGNNRVRIEVYTWTLSPLEDGTLVASYTCERRAPNLPFAAIERRFERIPELNLWKRELGFFDHGLGWSESRAAHSPPKTNGGE
jgi:hypothetical protein